MRTRAELRIELARNYSGDPLVQHARGEITSQQLTVLIDALPAELNQPEED
ncbi:hypothetical protein [Streptomyces sp. NPDC051577]|uniref:hypothetical protein n=1 Tax=Streptomyces sp. NPDC051577 TaxID=3155166 RepID=UPI0034197915